MSLRIIPLLSSTLFAVGLLLGWSPPGGAAPLGVSATPTPKARASHAVQGSRDWLQLAQEHDDYGADVPKQQKHRTGVQKPVIHENESEHDSAGADVPQQQLHRSGVQEPVIHTNESEHDDYGADVPHQQKHRSGVQEPVRHEGETD